jgi:hypothetical protein
VTLTRGGVQVDPIQYPLDQILLTLLLARNEGALLHGAGARWNGRCCLFRGPSGAGKSTISRRLAVRPDVEMLSDDRMIVRRGGDEFYAFGTPWPGDAGYAVNAGAPLQALCFLTKADACRLVPLPAAPARRDPPAGGVHPVGPPTLRWTATGRGA